ncbi:unnamed protein product [Bursaphelenchus okinawaensis]|uniref:Cytochrome P450 n=1 Tax=Bursaphelenchus okinawaensis TaxID=465554 RepID=A0A811KVT3_9BILA|nr:unnamed protein product [Bursaphelenchus okinawaensis]CAG9113047.1 unnamed protein product [Bursaphelenchus okinawaensis]
MLFYLFLVVLGIAFYNCYWKRRGLPPGPMPAPLIGNAHQIAQYTSSEEALKFWSKKYGDVFTYWIGERPVVAVCEYNKIMHYFVKNGELFQDRPDDESYLAAMGRGSFGVINIGGEIWKSQRRFVLHTLRDFGLGKNLMEERIVEECEAMFQQLEKQRKSGNPMIMLTEYIDVAIGSVINNLLFGYRYNEKNVAEFNDLKQRAQTAVTTAGSPAALICRPNPDFYKHFPLLSGVIERGRKTSMHLTDFFKERVNDHMEDLKNVDLSQLDPTDIVAAFLKERHRLEELGEDHLFTDQQLLVLVFDMWVAGQETTSNTLGWGVAYLIHHPEVQRKAHAELEKVIGSDRTVTTADRPDLPYIQALCNEIQRLCNMVPMNVIHAATEDVEVEGYKLKKGQPITPLISLVLYSDTIFPEPMKFKPERFLDREGKVKKVDELIPFSIGKRQCLGEGLARIEIFLMIANLLNKYRILPGKQMPSLKRHHGITVHITPFECQLESRFK